LPENVTTELEGPRFESCRVHELKQLSVPAKLRSTTAFFGSPPLAVLCIAAVQPDISLWLSGWSLVAG